MRGKRIIAITVIISVFLGFFLLANMAMGSSQAEKVVVDEWVIPHLGPFSGPYAGYGLECLWACEYAIEKINAAGGVAGKPMRMVKYDGAADPHKSVAQMSKIIDTKPLVMVGPHITPPMTAVGRMLVDEGLYTLAIGVGGDSAAPFFPWIYTSVPWFSTICGAGVGEWARRNPNIKSAVPIRDIADEWYFKCVESQKKVLESMGIKVYDVVTFDLKATVDFGPVAVAALKNNPDGFVFTSVGDPVAKTIVELHRRGVTDHSRFFIHVAADYPGLFEVAKGYLDGAYMSGLYNPEHEGKRWQELKKAYEATHENPAGFGCATGVDAPYLIKAAIEETGVTGDPKKLTEERIKIRDWINNQKDFPFIMGNFDIVGGVANYPIFLFRIENNEKKFLGFSFAEEE